MRDDIIDCMILAETPGIGPVTYRRLVKQYGSAKNALEHLPSFTKEYIPPKPSDIEEKLEASLQYGIQIITYEDAQYPEWLSSLDSSPVILYAKGRIELFSKPQLSIVGSRSASLGGRKFTETLSAELGSGGLSIVSGLALGIDAAAHKGALETGTIAVLGGGLDKIYPRENSVLFKEIEQKGLLISEFLIGTKPVAHNFPRRNRVIAGLSQGVVVVEAKEKSGSMITAQYALEFSRNVFAVPGFPYDPRSEGPNQLLYDGAHMARNADDILEVLYDSIPQKKRVKQKEASNSSHESLLSLLSPSPTEIDDIIRETNASPSEVLDILLTLEVEGSVIREGSKVYLNPKQF
jgi:DNA processing protein